MVKIAANEKIIKEYEKFYLVEVQCPDDKIYRKTVDKWQPSSKQKVIRYDMDKRLNRKYKEV